ncbi:MAG: NUDIX hydrolase [Anaerolineae bacterium]
MSFETPGAPAAVLIALLADPSGPQVILTRRTPHLTNHPDEISLPGGRVEPGDPGPVGAALRETFEEIGLPPQKVEILGSLPVYKTVSHYEVHPFVGWIEPPVEFVPDACEVAEVFLVPLDFIVDPANHHSGHILHEGEDRSFFVIPYPGHRIWGATAGMLVNLARTLDCRAVPSR